MTQPSDFTVADVLDEACSLIERGWCRVSYAQDAAGKPVSDTSGQAVRWCATGAINRVIHDRGLRGSDAWKAATAALEKATGKWGTCWNDDPGRTQAEVVGAFRRAADLLRKAETPATRSDWEVIDAYLTDIETVSA